MVNGIWIARVRNAVFMGRILAMRRTVTMAEFDRGIVSKEQEVIVKHTLYTDGTINTVAMGELVRCKDCGFYQINFHWCGLHYLEMHPKDFCSYGEKKGGDRDG